MSKTDEEMMMALRARARRTVQCIFASLAFGSLGVAAYFNLSPNLVGLTSAETNSLANAFLFLGTANALTMWVWDFLFWDDLEF